MAFKKFNSLLKIHEGEDNDDDRNEETEDDNVNVRCPRCGELIDDCKCQQINPWSTVNFHRVPKGKVIKYKPKQNFKEYGQDY